MDLQSKIEIFIVSLISAVCVVIPILDFVGALDANSWISQRIPVMTLLSLGALALYLVSQQHRKFNEVFESIGQSTDKILSKIVLDEASQKILNALNSIWDERDDEFGQLFKRAEEIAISEHNEALKKFLKDCETDFDNGIAFGTKLWQPWDINIIAVDLSGKVIYHSHEPSLEKKYPKDHPTWQILEKRNGTIFWLNHLRGKLSQVSDSPVLRKNLRFTKIYFREIPHLKAIVIIQSHINVVTNIAKPESIAK